MENFKPNLQSIVLFILIFYAGVLQAQVGINTTNIGDGAMLDVKSDTTGILIPRVNILDLSTIAPINTAAEESLLVYNTNVTTGKGFHYWDGEWIAINFRDGDFYEEGTTRPPTDIADDVFRTGNVAIGKNTADYPLEISNSSTTRGLNVTTSGAIAGNSFGAYFNNSNSSNGTSKHYGIQNNLTSNGGTGTITGTYNRLAGTVVRSVYGNSNYITGSVGGEHIGTRNNVASTGAGEHIGTYNQVNGSGIIKGTYNKINNVLAVGQNGYGTYNDVNSNDGNNYGGYFYAHGYDLTATGNYYAGYFDAHGGSHPYAAVFNRGHVVANDAGGNYDFRIKGRDIANDGTGEDLFFVDANGDKVGIGTDTPTEKLEVNGKIKATDINFSGLPAYTSVANAIAGGLVSGDLFRDSNSSDSGSIIRIVP